MTNLDQDVAANHATHESRYATVDIIHPCEGTVKTVNTVWVSKSEWHAINSVDYIEVDASGNLLPEFENGHGPVVAAAMREILKKGGRY